MANEQDKRRKFSVPHKWRKPLSLAGIVLVAFLIAFGGRLFGQHPMHFSQTELLQKARQGQVAEVVYKDDTHLAVKLKGDTREWDVTYPKAIAGDTFRALDQANVPVKPEKEEGFPWGSLLNFVWIALLLISIRDGMALIRRKTKEKLRENDVKGTRPTVKLEDVKGVPEVVAELTKIAKILRNPDVYAKLGARLPAGVVLYGPPGTGKTMAAKALAGEAGVPFFEVKGSEIRSKWIGEAGKAIRANFAKARRYPVSIIFFDEGDTIGGSRSDDNSHGGDQEHRAMVNELLAQMNRDQPGGQVFVAIATNDPDLLDEALTRPGRIDLKLAVLPPDVHGRRAILDVHTTGKPLADDVDLDSIARETYGQTGAALEALVNNATLEAGDRESSQITAADFEHALTVMNTGPVRKGMLVNEEDKRVTAFHEAGHAMCAAVLDKVADPTGVTILAHGYSGGHTLTIPDEEKDSQYTSKAAAKQQLVMFMGGVAGEKLALNADFTNGAASDRTQATDLAVRMVCRWGMGTYNSSFDRDWRRGPHADEVWRQVEVLLDEAEAAAIELLLKHMDAFKELVADLLEKETLRASDLRGYNPREVSDQEFEQLKEQYKDAFDGIELRQSERELQVSSPVTTC